MLYSYGVDLKSLRGEDAPEVILKDFREKLPETHHAFFSGLPLTAEFGDYFFTHAGVRPGQYLEKQQEADLLWIRDEFLASQMDFGKIVVHGHSAQEKPEFLPNRINLDSGAYITGRLTCLVLDGDTQRIL
jgi:serine/threonine protein phosphatase 1